MRLRAAARSAADIDKIPLPARASSRLAKRLSRSAGISSAVTSSTHPVTNGLSAARSLWIAILTCAGVIGLEPIAFFDVRWSEISFSVSSRIRSASVLGCCTRNSSAFCFIGSVTEICRSRSGSKPRRSRRAAGLNLQTLRLIRSMRRNGQELLTAAQRASCRRSCVLRRGNGAGNPACWLAGLSASG